MNIDIKYLFIIILVLSLLLRNNKVRENFYGWIPIPTRYFRHIGSDVRGGPIFIGHDKNGSPVFYDKNSENVGYGNKGYLGSFILGLFPFWYGYNGN